MSANHLTESVAVGLVAACRAPAPRRAAISEEDRDDAIRDQARAHYRAQRAAICADTGRATNDTCNSLLDFLEAAPEYRVLVRTALSCDPAVTGAYFQQLLAKVMNADAEVEAIRDIEQAALERED